jgi:hypothetical protein
MAVTAKNFKGSYSKNYMLTALINGIGDTSGGTWEGINYVYADNATQTSGTNYNTDFDGYSTLLWGSVASGSVAKSNTPVINISASTTINYIGLFESDTGGSDWRTHIEFTISAEAFPYAGSITITSCTLSISDTIGTPA